MNFKRLSDQLEGEFYVDKITRLLYATDASAYQELPVAVAFPKGTQDIQKLILFANTNNLTLIPRTAGTSLAGQVVGNGIVVDMSKHMTGVLEVNTEEKWVRVQPGVVLDELNMYLKQYSLFFGPETSTANRCMIGGMIGNNACGAHSLIYGSTRDHLLECKTVLSDGSEAEFKSLSSDEFAEKLKGDSLESKIYKEIHGLLDSKSVQEEIHREFPDPEIRRRNTGYAIDYLINMEPFASEGSSFNFCKLIAGSEGTLAFITEAKLNLVPLAPPETGLICVHLNTLEEALQANIIALEYNPGAIELIDDKILECTKSSIEHKKNRFFLEGDPGALLVIEFARESKEEIEQIHTELVKRLQKEGYGYAFPMLVGNDINKVWALRKAGLGLLSNIPGDAKAVPLIEDTAINPKQFPEYIAEFKKILSQNNLECVYYAHIATGELHLRPVLNLKEAEGVRLFRVVAEEIAKLVKKYKGSLSGEHGDGRLRGEFIPRIIGEKNFEIVKKVKQIWDGKGVFNEGKIVNTPPMDTQLRYEIDQKPFGEKTIFDFSEAGNMLQMAEKCNGSADCRKSAIIGGTMCPSYMASKDEGTTTRARANALRHYLTNLNSTKLLDHKDVYKVLDLCLSCKGCKSECPSSVDMAKLKTEFLQHYYDKEGVKLRSWLIANITKFNGILSVFPQAYNIVVSSKILSKSLNGIIGFSKNRVLPKLSKVTLKKWIKKNLTTLNNKLPANASQVYLFVDEFTNYNESHLGVKTIELLNRLGYKVNYTEHFESGRTYISKGFLRKAKKIALGNINVFKDLISEETPLIGIEPSAVLSFRDEYPDLAIDDLKVKATKIAEHAYTIDEFLSKEKKSGKINVNVFTKEQKQIKFHGHCQQKSIATTQTLKDMLEIPSNYKVEEIKSGCCGMAGSFGYEKEHYELSMKVGELRLFPEVRNTTTDTLVVASGTSCRCQIEDGTARKAFHPVEVLHSAIVDSI